MDLLEFIVKMASPEFMKMLDISFATLEVKYGPAWVEQLRSQMIKAPVSEEARNTVMELASQKMLSTLPMSPPSTPIEFNAAGKFEFPPASDVDVPYLKSVGKTALPPAEEIPPPKKTTAPKKKKTKSKVVVKSKTTDVVECQPVLKQDDIIVVEDHPVIKSGEMVVVEDQLVMKQDEILVVENPPVMKSDAICVTTQTEETQVVVKPAKKKRIIREKKTTVVAV